MTSFRQFEANRQNALRSTGPNTETGKQRSRANAFRHGLTAETVIGSLEDAEDYKAFEAAVISGYCAETAVDRELVLRLASLLWRLRRATAIETDLLQIQAEILRNRRGGAKLVEADIVPEDAATRHNARVRSDSESGCLDWGNVVRTMSYCFLRLANRDNGAFERLGRYEASLWRQTVQTLLALQTCKQP
jgi:hypothetical protein